MANSNYKKKKLIIIVAFWLVNGKIVEKTSEVYPRKRDKYITSIRFAYIKDFQF
jgi:hypothetical protein